MQELAAAALERFLRDNSGIKVTLIEPGMVDMPFFETRPGDRALRADDIARPVMFALDQPPGVDLNQILVRPTSQPS